MGKPFVGGKIQNINLSKINDALLYLDEYEELRCQITDNKQIC